MDDMVNVELCGHRATFIQPKWHVKAIFKEELSFRRPSKATPPCSQPSGQVRLCLSIDKDRAWTR
jgi:hypothetical protein